MNNKNLDKLITKALAIEAQEAKEAGRLGFMARVLVQATMPHSNPGNVQAWGRENGAFSMVMKPGFIKQNNEFESIGLPYGAYPRLLLAWLTTEAVRTKSPTLTLGDSLSGFMHEIGLLPTGGRWGTIGRLKEQMRRLFAASIGCTYSEKLAGEVAREAGLNFSVATAYDLWWHPQHAEQAALWQSTVTLSQEFFNEVVSKPVPVDMGALKILKQSPLKLDIYCWLTYRMSYLKKPTLVPWEALQAQFGANFGRTIDFKIKFLNHLKAVMLVYPEAKLEAVDGGLLLKPSRPHVKRLTD